jgi:hypothetical protein
VIEQGRPVGALTRDKIDSEQGGQVVRDTP